MEELAAMSKKADFIIGNLAGVHHGTAKAVSEKSGKPLVLFTNFPRPEGEKSWYGNMWDYNLGELKKILR